MELIYSVMEKCIPFGWIQYDFMKNALLSIIIISPVFGFLGTVVVNNRMIFFADVLGHSTFTGIALGALLGMNSPVWAMVVFAIIIAVGINYFKRLTDASLDTVLGVFFAFTVALGIVILSRNGGFAKYSRYLIGDILTVGVKELIVLAGMFVVICVFWIFASNKFMLIGMNRSLAQSRGINTFLWETLFTVLLAIFIMLTVSILGILSISSLLILPAAAARIFAKNFGGYTLYSVIISILSGIAGLILSYYLDTVSGATIVLFAVLFYAGASVLKRK
jgi:zinc transport system permease protein